MVYAILSEKEVKSSKGEVLGISRVTVDELSMKTIFKDLPAEASRAVRVQRLMDVGYSEADVQKITAAGLIP